MSLYRCVTTDRLVAFNFRPPDSFFPCFVGGEDEYACVVSQNECGIDIAGLPVNAETEPIIDMAREYSSFDVLSRNDLYDYVFVDRGATSLYDYFFDPIGGINRFLERAEHIVNRYLPR